MISLGLRNLWLLWLILHPPPTPVSLSFLLPLLQPLHLHLPPSSTVFLFFYFSFFIIHLLDSLLLPFLPLFVLALFSFLSQPLFYYSYPQSPSPLPLSILPAYLTPFSFLKTILVNVPSLLSPPLRPPSFCTLSPFSLSSPLSHPPTLSPLPLPFPSISPLPSLPIFSPRASHVIRMP